MAADLLLHGGTVRTLDPSAPRSDAVAVDRGRIVALGDDARTAAGAGTTIADLDGGCLLPGFADAHAHPLHGGRELLEAPIRDCESVDEVVRVVATWAAEHPELEWITGGAYDSALTPRGVLDAAWLDDAVPDRPVALTSADHHVLWVNSEALRRAGIDASTPDPPSGTIARLPDGTPRGTLIEWTAMDLVRSVMPQLPAGRAREGLVAAHQLFAAAGITWVQDALTTVDDVGLSLALAADGEHRLRMNLALRAEPGQWPVQRHVFGDLRREIESSPVAGEVSLKTVKLFADGVIEAGTAALLMPYEGDQDAAHPHGLPVWDPAELAEAVTAWDADGFQVHIHAIGDAGIRAALDAVERADRVNGPRDRRSVLAHAQLVDPADVPRFAQLGVIANFSPLWSQLDPTQVQQTMQRIGPDRAARQYPTASLLATGAVLSFGSDWPVSSHRPLDGLAVAVTRQTPAGEPVEGWIPHERMQPADALAAYTVGPAYQGFEEHLRGRIRVGMRADLVHIGADLLTLEAAAWPQVPVLGTWLGGRPVYQS